MRKRRKMSKRYRKMPINKEADRSSRILKICLGLFGVCLLVVGGYFGLKLAGVDISSVSKPSSEEPSSYTQISSDGQSSEDPSSETQDVLPESSAPEPVSIHILGVGDNCLSACGRGYSQCRCGCY